MIATPDVGDQAPDFELAGADGEAVSLAKLKGRTVVLYFYPKDDTPACTAEAIAFNRVRNAFQKTGALILGVSPDTAAGHAKFKRKFSLKLALASDPGLTMLQSYGVWQEKSLFGHKYMGVVRTTFLIDAEGRIARVWRKVKVAGHATAVLEAARALSFAPGPA
jgi:peroxiredoxin Q/BCP